MPLGKSALHRELLLTKDFSLFFRLLEEAIVKIFVRELRIVQAGDKLVFESSDFSRELSGIIHMYRLAHIIIN